LWNKKNLKAFMLLRLLKYHMFSQMQTYKNKNRLSKGNGVIFHSHEKQGRDLSHGYFKNSGVGIILWLILG